MKISKTCLSSKNILSLDDLKSEDILSILKLAEGLKVEAKRKNDRSKQLLRGKVLGMIFQKPSTRTRVSFEAGMYQMGGNAIYMDAQNIQLARGESIEDTARSLSLYVNCLMARVYNHHDLVKLAEAASVPVINGLSDTFHPCQILADLLTIKEQKKRLKGISIAWVGDGNNVCNDLLIGCAEIGIDISIASPRGYEPPEWIISIAANKARSTGAKVNITDDPLIAVQDADAVMTDTFVSIGKDGEKEVRKEVFVPRYQVNSQLMTRAKKGAIFLHCLPATRGQEVTAEVIDGKNSVVWEEAENRLHVQKALLYMLIASKNQIRA
ncbi:MAG TPA: ornithine carbamoyltransferase [Nitrososphaeraceae archaeon]|nr:ornithine carbamoyltransferase [Nitrososphaeraceae archaeon]